MPFDDVGDGVFADAEVAGDPTIGVTIATVQNPTVLQRSGAGRVFKSLGVAKRYCRINVISDTFMQC